MEIYTEDQWKAERECYQAEIRPWVERRRERRSRGLKHPFEDFLWEYYALRGGRMLQWSPGAGIGLVGGGEDLFPEKEGYAQQGDVRYLDPFLWAAKRKNGLRWIRNLLIQTQNRAPVYACLGLHEWAMVYEEKDVRHPQLPLRLGHVETRNMVESMPLQCTHFDAFRFFSESAKPLNATTLSSEGSPQQEQPGCLHANMDLYKWCMKLQPLVPSSLVIDCFHLAWRAREIDMRASPYDVSSMGYEPICIETPAGRKSYVALQKKISEEARPLRARLIEVLELDVVLAAG
ncbi:3-methyladenine DNA glycosylase [Kiritimatiellota bacterium B12222]|nr:3-methyladenine DNA glycosylase [Kiritimatiellota bacterium B12222]